MAKSLICMKDGRRHLEHQERHGKPGSKNKEKADELRVAMDSLSMPKPGESNVTVVAVSASPSSGSLNVEAASLTDKFREAVARNGLSLVLFLVEGG